MSNAESENAIRERGRLLQKLAQEHPADGYCWLRFAYFLDEYNWSAAAAHAYEKAQRLLPEKGDISLMRGSALARAGWTREGVKMIIGRLRASPGTTGYTRLAIAMLDVGKKITAGRLLKKAISLDPEFEEPYYLMGNALFERSKSDAIHFYREAIRLDPVYQLAWHRLGCCLILENETLDEGIDALHRAIELKSDDAFSWAFLGNAVWRRGELEEASSYFKKAYELCPDNEEFRRSYEEMEELVSQQNDDAIGTRECETTPATPPIAKSEGGVPDRT